MKILNPYVVSMQAIQIQPVIARMHRPTLPLAFETGMFVCYIVEHRLGVVERSINQFHSSPQARTSASKYVEPSVTLHHPLFLPSLSIQISWIIVIKYRRLYKKISQMYTNKVINHTQKRVINSENIIYMLHICRQF